MRARDCLREHWPEYLIEAWGLGTFMVSAGIFATLLGSPLSPLVRALPDPALRTVLIGIAMGLTAIAIIHSGWGKRSGAHLNPAVTLTFLRLGRIRPWDAAFFALSQALGAILGVLLVIGVAGAAFADPPVRYAATLPGPAGAAAAFAAEWLISTILMTTVLSLSAAPRLAPWTGTAAGTLVALYISLESPLSGMSMNPARSLASALPGGLWDHFWIYLTAPCLGMLCGAQIFIALRGSQRLTCAKLLHPPEQRCIHCGYVPPPPARLQAAGRAVS